MRKDRFSISGRIKSAFGVLARGEKPKGEAIAFTTPFPPMGYGPISSTDQWNNIMAKFGQTTAVDQYEIQTLWNAFMMVPAISTCVDTLCRTIIERGWQITNPEKRADKPPKELQDFFDDPHPIYDFEEIIYNALAEVFIYGWTVMEICVGGGKPVSLNELKNEKMQPNTDVAGRYISDDKAWSMMATETGKYSINFSTKEILFLRYLQKKKNAFFPLSPIEKIARSAAAEIHAQNHNISFFERGGRIGFAITMPAEIDQETRIQYITEIQDNYLGSQNAFRPIILFGGKDETDIKDLAASFTDMDFVNLRQFSIDEIARAFGVPPEKIGIIEKGTLGGKGSGDSQHRTFHQSTITPLKRHFARAVTKQILRSGFGIPKYRFEFVEEELKDRKTWFDMGITGYKDGALTMAQAAEVMVYMEWPVDLVESASDEYVTNPMDLMRPPDDDSEKEKKEDQKETKPGDDSDDGRIIELTRQWVPPVPLDRPLSRAEAMVNWPLIAKRLDEGKTFMDGLTEIFKDQQEATNLKVQKLMKASDYEGINSFRLVGVSRIRDKNRSFARMLAKEARDDIKEEITRKGPPASGDTPDEELMKFIIAYIDGRTDWFFQAYTDQIKVHMMESLKGGVGIDQAILNLNQISLDFYTVRSERFYRTITTQVYNDVRVDTMEKIGEEAIPVYEYSAILDGRTSKECALLDGLNFKSWDTRLHRVTAPNHFNCRSLIVGVVRVIYEANPGEFITIDEDFSKLARYEKALNLIKTGFGGNK